MEMTAAVLAIAGAITLGAMSPGPSFLMVARTSIAASRADGLAAALGMGVGGVAFAVMALAGLHVVLIAVPWLYVVLKVAGGAYLIYIGWMIWRGAMTGLVEAAKEVKEKGTFGFVERSISTPELGKFMRSE